MIKEYKDLFAALANTCELLAEQVMEFNHTKGDAEGEQNAQIMRDDYIKLGEKLKNPDAKLNRSDYIKLLLCSMIVSNNVADRIERDKRALTNYKTIVIPRLQRIVDETTNDEEASTLATELFSEKVDN